MYSDPLDSLKTELEDVKKKREELEEALRKLIATRQRIAESLSRLAGGITVDKKPRSSALLGAFILATLAIPLTGVVISRLWGWFLVEPFDLPHLSVVEATGVYLLFMLFGSYSKIASEELLRTAARMVMRPGIIWLFGWLLHWLV